MLQRAQHAAPLRNRGKAGQARDVFVATFISQRIRNSKEPFGCAQDKPARTPARPGRQALPFAKPLSVNSFGIHEKPGFANLTRQILRSNDLSYMNPSCGSPSNARSTFYNAGLVLAGVSNWTR